MAKQRKLRKPRQLTRVLWAQRPKREPTRKPYNRQALRSVLTRTDREV